MNYELFVIAGLTRNPLQYRGSRVKRGMTRNS